MKSPWDTPEWIRSMRCTRLSSGPSQERSGLPSAGVTRLRPARAADTGVLQALFHRHSPNDVYTRFFQRVRSLSYVQLQNEAKRGGEKELQPPLDHHLLDLGNGLGRIEMLGAGLGAIHDGVAAIEPEGIFQI